MPENPAPTRASTQALPRLRWRLDAAPSTQTKGTDSLKSLDQILQHTHTPLPQSCTPKQVSPSPSKLWWHLCGNSCWEQEEQHRHSARRWARGITQLSRTQLGTSLQPGIPAEVLPPKQSQSTPQTLNKQQDKARGTKLTGCCTLLSLSSKTNINLKKPKKQTNRQRKKTTTKPNK